VDIIPVLDLMVGRVVLGRAGERSRYRPIDSVLVAGSAPPEVAEALRRATACPALYVADLDAIQGTGDHLDVVRELSRRVTADLWVDAAIVEATGAARLLAAGAARAIVGTETLPRLEALTEIRAAVPPQRMLLSLDVGADGVLSACSELRGLPPVPALEALGAETLTHVLVLTLDRVGTAAGPDLAALRSVRAAFPRLTLVAGGGVRSVTDLRALAGAGADAVLVATALHRGWITAGDVAELGDR